MFAIAKRTAVGALLLLIMPLAVWVSGWTWQPGYHGGWLKLFYWITETVTQPWGIITHVILCGGFIWGLRSRRRSAIMLFITLTGVIVIGQGMKSWLKTQVQEPRPFVVWLEKSHHIPVDEFYTLERKERGQLVAEQLVQQPDIPHFLGKHWQKETGFSFPSGHSLFAASWALLGMGLLWPRRHMLATVVLLLWATAVMGSRLLLGMHWPQDLAAATVMSWVLVTIATWLMQKTRAKEGAQEARKRQPPGEKG